MAEGNKIDLAAKLSDEIWMKIFDRLPSLCSKLRLESVNHRFQRCLVQLLHTKPIPLDIDVHGTRLNHYYVAMGHCSLPFAVQTLAKKAKFTSIDLVCGIDYYTYNAQTQVLNWILSTLVSSSNDCLENVTRFRVVSMADVRETLLAVAFRKCTKLSDVLLDLPNEYMKNLGLVLKEKTLTQLSIVLRWCNQEKRMIELYQSIKPNMLKKVKLDLLSMKLRVVDQLVTELCSGVWAAVEEMKLKMTGGYLYHMERLFSTIIRKLPALRKGKFVLRQDEFPEPDELVAALTSLFTNQIEITVLVGKITDIRFFVSCQLVSIIRQVRAVHPDLQVDFVGDSCDKLRLTLGKVSFSFEPKLQPGILLLRDAKCLDCGIFYPTLIEMLKERARDRVCGEQQDVHLTDARMDRCRVGTVVAHLNREAHPNEEWKALHAEMNEAQTLATITFESESMASGQFQITVDCGQCLTNGCSGCAVG